MTTTTHRGSAILWIAILVLAGLLMLAYCRPFDMYLLPGLLAQPQLFNAPTMRPLGLWPATKCDNGVRQGAVGQNLMSSSRENDERDACDDDRRAHLVASN